MLTLVVFIVIVALLFDFRNGFHDAANSIATVVATRVLTPTQAVVWAAFFNFVAAFVFGTKVAGTISGDMVDNKLIDIYVVAGGLSGAIIWNIITWLLRLPTSSSHALVAGVAGAAVVKSGFAVILWQGWGKGWGALLLFIILPPLLGMVPGSFMMTLVS